MKKTIKRTINNAKQNYKTKKTIKQQYNTPTTV